jgi:hypothetical protein
VEGASIRLDSDAVFDQEVDIGHPRDVVLRLDPESRVEEGFANQRFESRVRASVDPSEDREFAFGCQGTKVSDSDQALPYGTIDRRGRVERLETRHRLQHGVDHGDASSDIRRREPPPMQHTP